MTIAASLIACVLLGMIVLQLQSMQEETRRLLRAIAMMVSVLTGPVGEMPDGPDPDIEFATRGGDDAHRD